MPDQEYSTIFKNAGSFPKTWRWLPVVFFLSLVFAFFSSASEITIPQPFSVTPDNSGAGTTVPDLAEIVPLQVKLVGRLKDLQKQLEVKIDDEQMEKSYAELETDLTRITEKFDTIKNVEEYKYRKLVTLREVIRQKSDVFQLINKPVSQLIRQLGGLRSEWQTEANRWNQWRDAFLKEGEFEQLKSTFDEATETIDTAQDLILSELNTLLGKQERAGAIERQIDTLINDVEDQIRGERQNRLFAVTPPLFSKQYLSELASRSLWERGLSGLDELPLTDKRIFLQHGWVIGLQIFTALLIIIAILKRKQFFQEQERWRFIALYPITSGVFLSFIIRFLVYEYYDLPNYWKFVSILVGGIAFARVMKGVVAESWKSWAINVIVGVAIITRIVDIMSLPIPVYRLYMLFTALAGLLLLLALSAKLKKQNNAGIYQWLSLSGAWFCAGMIFLEMWGRTALASYLFISLIDTIAAILIFVLFMYMVRGCLEWLFSTPLLRRSTTLNDSETRVIIKRLTHFFDALIIFFIVIPSTLMIWGRYQSLGEAVHGVMSFGVNIGSNRLTVSLLIVSATILSGAFLLSWLVQKLLIDQVLFQRRMEKGARISIARLAHYFIVFVGFLFAISALGLEITKITILFSALGVGIGFGLQGIVNNFVSGLVLLFEQPVRVGDLIEFDGMWAEIKHIGIRATVVRNFDSADLIIPNANLISNLVTNWTLSDRQARLKIAVGVAYGSDVALVKETLIECARDNKRVQESPSPKVHFLEFGASSLDFELRVFVPASFRIEATSELHEEIEKRFREKGITIAFPQLDMHLPGLDIEPIKEVSNLVQGEEA
mgnify:CR=1 FL=1